jgi:phage-related protein
MNRRQVYFHPKALEEVRGFSRESRKAVGKALRELQLGKRLGMLVSRPMPSVALGVAEIRVQDRWGIYRTFYYLKSSRGILVFHAFMKKTQKTPQQEIELARTRLKELLHANPQNPHR